MEGANIAHAKTCYFEAELAMVDMVCTSPETLVYLYVSGKDSILNMFCFRGKDYKIEASKDRGDKILNLTGTQIISMQGNKTEIGSIKCSQILLMDDQMVITVLQDENQKGKFQLYKRIDAGFHKIQYMPSQEDWKLSQAIFMSSRAF